jgi:hypothetical protein
MANPAVLKVKLLHDTIVEGASEPRGVAVYGKSGEVHELPKWEALHLCHCHPEFPRATLITAKGN